MKGLGPSTLFMLCCVAAPRCWTLELLLNTEMGYWPSLTDTSHPLVQTAQVFGKSFIPSGTAEDTKMTKDDDAFKAVEQQATASTTQH